MRWLSKFVSHKTPLLILLIAATCFGQTFDSKSIASRLSRYGDRAQALNGIYFADTKYYANIQAAITAAGTTGAVIIPPDYAGGDSYTNPNGITIIDLRKVPTATTNIKLALDTQLPTISTAGKISGTALPNPQASVLGGIESKTCTGTDKISALNTDGTVTCSADQTTAGGSGITSLNGLSASSQSFAIGTSGNSPAFSSVTSTHTLNIPLADASGSVTAGLLSNAELVSFIKNNPSNTQTITNTDNTKVPLQIVAASGQATNIFAARDTTQTCGLVVQNSGQLAATSCDGSADLVIAHNTLIANLNANYVGGKTYSQINPMNALGSLIYSSDTLGTPTNLAPNTSTTSKILIQTGTGTVSTAPVWGSLTAAMLPAQAVRTDTGNTWSTGIQNLGGATETIPDKLGTLAQRSATCDLGATYHTTDTHITYRCDPANTWIVDGGSGGGGSLVDVVLPTTDFTKSGTTTLTFAWGGTTNTAAPSSANTVNAIVKRDASGNFSANDVTVASLTTNGAGVSAIDIPAQTCVVGSAGQGRIMYDTTANALETSENGTACVEIAKVDSGVGGDLSGAINNATVTKLQGNPVSPNAPTTNFVLTWDGSQWTPALSPSAPVSSVFGRTGAVTAATNDYTAAQVTNAFDVTVANTLTEVATPSAPASGHLAVYAKTSSEQLCIENSAAAETCFAAPGAIKLSDLTDPTSSTARNMGGFNWGLTQTANSTGDMFALTGFNTNTGTGRLFSITGGGATDGMSLMFLTNTNPANIPLVIKAAASQTANLFNITDNTGALLAGVNSAGKIAALNYGALSGAANLTFFGLDSTTSSLTGSVTLRGGDFNANTASSNAEPVLVRGGNSQSSTGNGAALFLSGGDLTNSTSASGVAGDLEMRPGMNQIGGGGPNGFLRIDQGYNKQAPFSTGFLECLTADNTVSDCTVTSNTFFVGVARGTNGTNGAIVQQVGKIIIALDGTYSPAVNQFACSSTTNAAKSSIANSCPAGRTVGIVTKAGTATTSAEVTLVHF